MSTLSFVCITCGGTQYTEDKGVRICRHCGNRYNTTSIDDGLTAKLQYAMNERQEADFDKARRRYDAIISETEGVNDAACEQACWGKFLCEQYVIFYRNDADESIPSFWNINDDKCEDSTNYRRAIKYGASSGNGQNYEKLAKLIELYKQKYRKVKQEIPEGSEIFICFKDTGTTDRNLGYTLYNKFSGKYDIFFSPESLNSISGNDYEPYIYHALTTAKVLIVICSSREALESKWVHNEWWRFVNFAGAADKTIIPILRTGFAANQLPYEIKNCQAHSENIELVADLQKRLQNIFKKEDVPSVASQQLESTVNLSIPSRPTASTPRATVPPLKRSVDPFKDSYVVKCREKIRGYVNIASGTRYSIGLRSDGTVVGMGWKYGGVRSTLGWYDIIDIATGGHSTAGVKSNGTLVAVGHNDEGQCNVENAKDVVAAAVEWSRTVVLRANGTVGTTDNNPRVHGWKDIVAIDCELSCTVGLKSDGTVVSTDSKNLGAWKDIVAIACGQGHTVGLRADGIVLATGKNDHGQCNVQKWTDIVAVACGKHHTIGIKADGTVVAVGKNDYGQCDTRTWKGIIAVAGGDDHTIGLTSRGYVAYVGYDSLIRDYKSISVDGMTCIGPVEQWKLFEDIDNLEEERIYGMGERKAKDAQFKCRVNKKCQHCGEEFKGLFFRKCSVCEMPKDY